jgi:hypothetical protein
MLEIRWFKYLEGRMGLCVGAWVFCAERVSCKGAFWWADSRLGLREKLDVKWEISHVGIVPATMKLKVLGADFRMWDPHCQEYWSST